MTTTYHPEQDRVLDRLRFVLGDTALDSPLVTPDETYAAVIVRFTMNSVFDERSATLALADGMIARLSLEATQTSQDGVQSATYANRLSGLQALATRLRKELADIAAAAVLVVGRPYNGSVRSESVW